MISRKEIEEYSNSIPYEKMLLQNHNGILITEEQLEILKKYNIDIASCGGMGELLYTIDEILDEEDALDLEWVAEVLQERNYYENTQK